MEHSFDIDIAKEYGINEAIILKHIYYWYIKNKHNEQNYYDGTYWSYNSYSAFAEIFPYLNARQIKYAINNLKEDGLITIGNYNKVSFDKTNWYSMTDKGISVIEKKKLPETIMSVDETKLSMDETKLSMDETKLSAQMGQNCPTNTIYKPNINTDINTNIKKVTTSSKEDSVTKEKPPYKEIVDLFNSICISYPTVKIISEKRKGSINARYKKYSLDDIKEAFSNMEESDFLKGNNDRKWSATFDWVMGSENNMAKVLEGNYKNKLNEDKSGKGTNWDDALKARQEQMNRIFGQE